MRVKAEHEQKTLQEQAAEAWQEFRCNLDDAGEHLTDLGKNKLMQYAREAQQRASDLYARDRAARKVQ